MISTGVKPFFHPFHHLFHLRKGNPKTSSTVAGGHTLGSQWKEVARNMNISYPPSGLVPGKFWKEGDRTDSSSGQWGHRAGFIALATEFK